MTNPAKQKMVKEKFKMDDLKHEEMVIHRKIASYERQRHVDVKIGYQYLIIDEHKWKWFCATQQLVKGKEGTGQGSFKKLWQSEQKTEIMVTKTQRKQVLENYEKLSQSEKVKILLYRAQFRLFPTFLGVDVWLYFSRNLKS